MPDPEPPDEFDEFFGLVEPHLLDPLPVSLHMFDEEDAIAKTPGPSKDTDRRVHDSMKDECSGVTPIDNAQLSIAELELVVNKAGVDLDSS